MRTVYPISSSTTSDPSFRTALARAGGPSRADWAGRSVRARGCQERPGRDNPLGRSEHDIRQHHYAVSGGAVEGDHAPKATDAAVVPPRCPSRRVSYQAKPMRERSEPAYTRGVSARHIALLSCIGQEQSGKGFGNRANPEEGAGHRWTPGGIDGSERGDGCHVLTQQPDYRRAWLVFNESPPKRVDSQGQLPVCNLGASSSTVAHRPRTAARPMLRICNIIPRRRSELDSEPIGRPEKALLFARMGPTRAKRPME